MGTPNPRPRGGASLSDLERKNADDRKQIRRLLTTPARPKPAAPVSGGIVGMAQVVSSGGVSWLAGNSEMTYAGVTYGAPSDPNAGTPGAATVAVSSWLSVDGHRLLVTPGWYIPVMTMRAHWDDVTQAPLGFAGPYMSGGYDSVHNDLGCHPRVQFSGGGNGGFQQIANYGPTFIADGSDLHAELRSLGGPPAANNNPSSALSRIVWNITKLG